MAGMNYRDRYQFEPYGTGGAGGFLDVLQAMLQGQNRVDPRSRIPQYASPATPQASDFGGVPPTRFTVRPTDAYLNPDSDASESAGGLLGQLLAYPAEQRGYQPIPSNSGWQPPATPDPDFRQLSRAPIANRAQAAINIPNPSDDPSSLDYGQPILSDVTPDPIKPGSQYAQAAMALCGGGPAGCAIGGGITTVQALATALLGGAIILSNRKRPEVGSDEWSKQFWAQKAAEARARDKAGREAIAANGPDPGDYCTNRYDNEMKECYERSHEYPHWDFLAACKKQASERLASCRKNGGRPALDEPRKWGPDDEEVYRNLSR